MADIYLFRRLFGSAHGQLRAVRAPGEEGDAVGVLLEGLAVPQLQRLGVKLPDNDSHVLGASCELEAVGRELAVPDFFAMVVEHLE